MIVSAGGQALRWRFRNFFATPERLAAHNLGRFRKRLAWVVERSPYYADVCRREFGVPARIAKRGDLWKPLLQARGRFDLSQYV